MSQNIENTRKETVKPHPIFVAAKRKWRGLTSPLLLPNALKP
jgi:hypothetical protein